MRMAGRFYSLCRFTGSPAKFDIDSALLDDSLLPEGLQRPTVCPAVI